MPAVFVSGSGGAGSAASVTCTAPASIVSGNLLVAILGSFSGANTTPPSGWTTVGYNGNSAVSGNIQVCTKTATGSEPGSYTFNATGATGIAVVILQFSGTGTVLDGSCAFNPQTGTTTTGTAPSQTPTLTGDELMVAYFSDFPTSSASTPAGMTAGPTAFLASYAFLASFYQALVSMSATGAKTTTFGSGTAYNAVSLLVAPPAVVTVTATAAVALGPVTVAAAAGTGAISGCVRAAWLTLGAQTVPFENVAAGYFCSSLDLGFPTVRDVVTNRPDTGGAIDRTQYFGPRVVNAQIMAITGAGARIDDVTALFAPFLDPAARPTLHYALDRAGHPQRAMTVRAAGFSWPVAGPYERSIQLQLVAADPVAYDPAVQSVTVAPANTASIVAAGDLPARPLIRITGPITAPAVTITPPSGPAWKLAFLGSFVVPAGHFVDVDTDARTIYLDADPAQARLASLDWTVSSWQWVPAGTTATITVAGTSTSAATQAAASWRNGYLT